MSPGTRPPAPAGAESDLVAAHLLERLEAAVKGRALYPLGHPRVDTAVRALVAAVRETAAASGSMTVLRIGDDLMVESTVSRDRAGRFAGLRRVLAARGVERITFGAGLDEAECRAAVDGLSGAAPLVASANVIYGRVKLVDRADADETPEGASAHPSSAKPDHTEEQPAIEAASQAFSEFPVEPRSSYTRLEELVWYFAETMARSSDALLALAAGEGRHGAVFPHSLTVALLVLGHARRLGIQAPALQEIGLGALLHDIGKIHLPPQLIEAHGRLGDENWGELRRHPEVGAAAILAVPAAGAEAVLIAFEHHLRFDGRPSFPPLARPRRPGLGAQITAVSDSWDNVLGQIGELPPALAAAAPVAAAQILRDRAGTYLNPFLVEDFLGWLGA